MFLLYSVKSPIDLSFSLKSLKDGFIKVVHCYFDLHAQRDVAEILQILLEELTDRSSVTSAAYNIKSLTSITFLTCHQLNRTEDILHILHLPVLEDFPTLLAKVLEIKSLIGSNTLYCNICSGIRESDFKLSLSSVENCLIVQLNRFFVLNGIATKNSAPFFVLSSTEAVTELEDEVFYTKIFNLAAIHVFQLLTSYPMDRKVFTIFEQVLQVPFTYVYHLMFIQLQN